MSAPTRSRPKHSRRFGRESATPNCLDRCPAAYPSRRRCRVIVLASAYLSEHYALVPGLPDGWTVDRVREVAQGDAELLALDTVVLLDDRMGYVALVPSTIISFTGLCLVLNADDGLWYMGQLDDGGTIVCWSAYGDDLEEATRRATCAATEQHVSFRGCTVRACPPP